jgi:hypothetical protein
MVYCDPESYLGRKPLKFAGRDGKKEHSLKAVEGEDRIQQTIENRAVELQR